MITGVFGLPRAGKSTFLAYVANCALHHKIASVGFGFWKTDITERTDYARIYCNFPISGTYRLDFDDLGKKDFSNCLILIDEIMLLCDSRNWKTFGDELKYFIALHGHMGITIVWCSQRYNDCDVKIRALTQQFLLIERRGEKTRITPLTQYIKTDIGTISEGYEPAPLIGRSTLRRKKYYWLFDSYAHDDFPPAPAVLWDCGAVAPPPSLFSRAVSGLRSCSLWVRRSVRRLRRRLHSVRRTRTKDESVF